MKHQFQVANGGLVCHRLPDQHRRNPRKKRQELRYGYKDAHSTGDHQTSAKNL
jgi:hypothetical protein